MSEDLKVVPFSLCEDHLEQMEKAAEALTALARAGVLTGFSVVYQTRGGGWGQWTAGQVENLILLQAFKTYEIGLLAQPPNPDAATLLELADLVGSGDA